MTKRDKYLLLKYGIDESEYDAIYNLQKEGCAICGRPHAPKQKLAVDHKHQKLEKKKTGIERRRFVRGLLCSYCNRGLPFFRDNAVLLENAAKYLLEWPARTILH